MALGVLFVSHGAMAQAQADPSVQRVAVARTHADEISGHQAMAPTTRHAVTQRAVSDLRTAKLQSRRSSELRSGSTPSGDGSRFVYDSCGCSNE